MSRQRPPSYYGTVRDIGIDYLTLVALDHAEADSLSSMAYSMCRSQVRRGFQESPWGGMGYKGFKTEGLQWGERDDGVIVRLSGELSKWEWWDYYQVCNHATRVDFQTTVAVELPTNLVVQQHYAQARRFWSTRCDGPTVTLMKDNLGGATLYIGKRQSRQLLRCYAKDAQSKSPTWSMCVRYEGEFHDCRARMLLEGLSNATDAPRVIAATVHEMFGTRGVSPRFVINRAGLQCKPTMMPTDVDRKLAWLETQVKPSVQWLLDHVSVDQVISVLGLGPSIDDCVKSQEDEHTDLIEGGEI